MTTHGKRHDPLYKVWCEMRYRCQVPEKHNYKHYGGRGIRVCARWEDFANFLADMGPRPPGTTLDRIDTDGNYEPSNCRWADKVVQMNNMRTNRLLKVDGVQMTMAEASRRWKVKVGTIWKRLQLGWDEEDAAKRTTRRHKPYANLRGMGR